MAFRLKRKESIRDGVRRIADEQIDRALGELDDPQLSTAEKVHQVRKRCKKLRALIRLVRPGFKKVYQHENAWFRDTARSLSTIRDAQTMIDACDRLLAHTSQEVDRAAVASVRQQLAGRLQELREQPSDLNDRLASTADRLRQARSRIAHWQGDLNQKALAAGLQKTYRSCRRAMRKAEGSPSPSTFHEWRKRVKDHWYHVRLIENAWPELFTALGHVAGELSEWLGDDHDLALLQSCVRDDADTFGSERDIAPFTALVDRRRQRLQQRALRQGRRLFCDKPSVLANRWMRYWTIWRR